MAASVYVAASWKSKSAANPEGTSLWFDNNGIYWHFYRYFEAANLDRREELVDLYGGREIDGYQLDRLEDELRAARDDAASKPDQWQVLTGWNEHRSRENEIWQSVERKGLLELIEGFLGLIKFARE